MHFWGMLISKSLFFMNTNSYVIHLIIIMQHYNPGTDPGSDPGWDPGSDPGSDPSSDPGFILSYLELIAIMRT